MIVTLLQPDGEWQDNYQIWVQLEDAPDPADRPESFIIGVGNTLHEARVMALATLHQGIQDVEALRGTT